MTDTPVAPLTRLASVNFILAALGQSPITTLLGDLRVDAQKSLNEIDNTTREVQHRAWHFNSEEDFPLPIANDGSVTIPVNTVRVGVGCRDRGYRDYVQRGALLYDRRGHTFMFLTPPRVDLVLALPFDQMPDPARWLVTCLAGRRVVGPETASPTAYRFSDVEVGMAWGAMENHDRESRGSPSMKQVNPHVGRMRSGGRY